MSGKKLHIQYLLLILIFLSGSVSCKAQISYKNAIGVRAGFSSGLTFKHTLNRNGIIDLNALYNRNGFQLSGFYKYQIPAHDKKQLQIYAGAGPYGGNWNADLAIGAALIAGAEFIFREAPIIIGIDWKPMLNVWKQFDYAIADFGVRFEVYLK